MGCCGGVLIIPMRHMCRCKACVGGLFLNINHLFGGGLSMVSPVSARSCVCLGLDGWFFPEQGRLLLLSLEPITGKVRCHHYISRTTESVVGFFYIRATFEECYSDFLLQPWHPSYSTVWRTSTSSESLGNWSWIKNLLWVLCLSFSVTPPRQQVQVKNPYLDTMEEDILYHFSLSTKTHNLPKMFGDIKVSEKEVVRKENRVFSEARQLNSLLSFHCFISFSNSLCVWVAVPTEWKLLPSSCTRSWNCPGTLKRSRIYAREPIVTACIKWDQCSLSA